MWKIELPDLASTRALGAALGHVACSGTRVALEGDLGAGKTSLAQGVGVGLGLDAPVVSPTFVLLAEYEAGRLPLLHGDAYRLSPGEAEAIGMDETIETWPGLVLLEWADRFPELIGEEHLRVRLLYSEEGRCAEVTAVGSGHLDVLKRWQAAHCE
jgi:tRNA threonylcarbamoyladenosine biosynthesis protein TsaE